MAPAKLSTETSPASSLTKSLSDSPTWATPTKQLAQPIPSASPPKAPKQLRLLVNSRCHLIVYLTIKTPNILNIITTTNSGLAQVQSSHTQPYLGK